MVLKRHIYPNLIETINLVATVPTVYGIETNLRQSLFLYLLQLQQYLPFTVLKPNIDSIGSFCTNHMSCNSTYRLRY